MATTPFKVKAVYEYKSPHDDDLSFPNGQIITVTEEEDSDWYVGEYEGNDGAKHEGLFPRNFVEKYEPAAPPRPVRTRTKKETAPPLTAEPIATETKPEPIAQPVEPEKAISEPVIVSKEETRAVPPPPEAAQSKPESKAEPLKAATSAKGPPPPVNAKPSSFKDRIAAFNRGSAQPVAPIKPGPQAGGSSSTFIKKPFVAPPPARDSYVPPPKDKAPLQKTYKREEDPEILQRQQQDQEDAERAGLAPGDTEEGSEEVVKSTSLKDRIALLQKQQQEQASRRAENVHKEKPQRPQKQRTESAENLVSPPPPTEDPTPSNTIEAPVSRSRQSVELSRDVPKPPQTAPRPARQLTDDPSDGNEADQSGAGDTTEDGGASPTEVEDVEEKARFAPHAPSRTSTTLSREMQAEPEHTVKEEEVREVEAEEDEMDEETRRKEELRARMAKMSGGMGMPGMFSMPQPGPAPKKRQSGTREDRPQVEPDPLPISPPIPPQRLPMASVPTPPHRKPSESLPTTPKVGREPEPEAGAPLYVQNDPEKVPDIEDLEQKSPTVPSSTSRAPPPTTPQERALPPLPPSQVQGAPPIPGGRAVPPPPPRESRPIITEADLMPPSESVPSHPAGPRSPLTVRTSQIMEPTSPTSASEKRFSRAVPPIPMMPPLPTAESRPPPPPPPTAAPPSRRSTEMAPATHEDEDEEQDEESEYEGDYDTDIASGADHRNALNESHKRELSLDEGTLSEDTRSPVVAPPAVPTHRAVPPPPPHQLPPTRPSVDVPSAPLPVPQQGDDDYDPYSYARPTHGIPSPVARTTGDALQQESDPALYGDMPIRSGPASTFSPPQDRAPPLPPQAPVSRQSKEIPRTSLDVPRQSMAASRRSVEQGRPSMDQGHMARDVDLAAGSMWWTQSNAPPPVFQNRNDILYDFEESTTARRGGRTSVSRDIYVLFPDYSQTVVSARFDPKEPSDVILEQRHEAPPAKPRQDQLEAAYSRLGQVLIDGASKRVNHTVGDGSPQALISDILQTIPNVLMPVGTRAYGALIYANMANATVSQHDEIRPGDIISFRNAKFSGKHGAMHTKYNEDVGKPEHVGVVAEWDGTRKKVRAYEQGRDGEVAKGKAKKGKVELQAARLADLRSGEVKVWRIMEKGWVGWDS